MPIDGRMNDGRSTLKVILLVIGWSMLLIIYDLCCKRTLMLFPFPWAVTLGVFSFGSVFILLSSALGLRDLPFVQINFQTRRIAPIAVLFTLGCILNMITISGNKAAASSFLVKSLEPMVSFGLCRSVLGVSVGHINIDGLLPWILPVVLGSLLAAVRHQQTQLTWASVMNATSSCMALCMQMVYSQWAVDEQGPKLVTWVPSARRATDQSQLASLVLLVSTLGLAPFCLIIEGPYLVPGLVAAAARLTGPGEAAAAGGGWASARAAAAGLLPPLALAGAALALGAEGAARWAARRGALGFAVLNTVARSLILLFSFLLFGGLTEEYTVAFLTGVVLTTVGGWAFFNEQTLSQQQGISSQKRARKKIPTSITHDEQGR